MKRTLLAAIFAACFGAAAIGAQAAPAGMPTVKPYHQTIKDCAVCQTEENAGAGNKFVVPSDKTCMGCHGDYKAMAEKTKNLPEPNPHWSNHYGSGLSCTACHREHSQSKVYCNECHEFSYKIK